MKKAAIQIIMLALSVCMISTIDLSGQNINPEEKFFRARELAFNGNFAAAGDSLVSLLDSFPDYGDAKVLLARVYAWQKKYNEAVSVIEAFLLVEPQNADALEARGDILRWMEGEKREAEELAAREEAARREAEDLAAREEAARREAEELRVAEEARALAQQLADSLAAPAKNEIIAGYYFDTFREPYDRFWQVWKAGATHLTSFGRVSGALNVGHLISSTGNATNFQLETEAWPKFSASTYGWINYAWSPGEYFPRHRASAEIWQTIGSGWVASAGVNYYYFDRNIFITTISGEKYIGPWWIAGRVYFYFKDSGITNSLFLNIRRYFNDTDYLQFTAGTGTAPDEPFDIRIDLERLGATTFKLAYNRQVKHNLSVRVGIGYSREEYQELMHRNRIDGTVSLIYKLPQRR